MGRLRFVRPDVTKYELSEGDWIEVKNQLTAKEKADLAGAGVPSFQQRDGKGQAFTLDFAALKLARIPIYVVRWSLADAAGNQTTPSIENVEQLDDDTVNEIDDLLDKHKKAMEVPSRPSVPAGDTN